MGLPKIIQIPCHHVLANKNDLKLRKGEPLKQFCNINLGIGIIKKITFFVRIFDISSCVFNQISIGIAHWMKNLIPHPTSYPNRNLSKNMGRYVENTNKKVVFFFSSSRINKYYFIIFLRRPILDLKFPLMTMRRGGFCQNLIITPFHIKYL